MKFISILNFKVSFTIRLFISFQRIIIKGQYIPDEMCGLTRQQLDEIHMGEVGQRLRGARHVEKTADAKAACVRSSPDGGVGQRNPVTGSQHQQQALAGDTEGGRSQRGNHTPPTGLGQ